MECKHHSGLVIRVDNLDKRVDNLEAQFPDLHDSLLKIITILKCIGFFLPVLPLMWPFRDQIFKYIFGV